MDKSFLVLFFITTGMASFAFGHAIGAIIYG